LRPDPEIAIQISPNGETSIDQAHLKNALDLAGYKLPNHQVTLPPLVIVIVFYSSNIVSLHKLTHFENC
jgi:hypothetical protein